MPLPDGGATVGRSEGTGPAAGTVPDRVAVTPAAEELLRSLAARHGPLMFHQSGGCCDGSSPMCYPVGMFRTGPGDVLLGTLEVAGTAPVEVYMSRSQFEYWKCTHLTIDVVEGRGSGFSVEVPEGKRFLTRSRMFTDAELRAFGLLPTAEQPTAGQPTAEQPTAGQPAGEQPTAGQPSGEQPTAEQPTGEQPTAAQPAAHPRTAARG